MKQEELENLLNEVSSPLGGMYYLINIIRKLNAEIEALKDAKSIEAESPFKISDYVVDKNSGDIVKVTQELTPEEEFIICEHSGKNYITYPQNYKPLKIDNVEQFIKDYVEKYDSDFVADWSDDAQPKCSIYFNHSRKRWGKTSSFTSEDQGAIYMSTKCAEKLVDILNKVVER